MLCGCRTVLDLLIFDWEPTRPDAELTYESPVIGKQWVIPGLKMVFEPAAAVKFKMGSTEIVQGKMSLWHYVTLTKPFWMGKYEVTQEEYTTLTADNRSNFEGDDLPVENVRWHEALRFCQILTILENQAGRLPKGYVYRLPTEAEWEYCCRAGGGEDFAGDIDSLAWYSANSKGKTHNVGIKQPNGFGLFDTHGNVAEWCMDRGGEYTEDTAIDPKGPETGEFRVVRGGSWYNTAKFCRSTYRYFLDPENANSFTGFRVVLAPGTSADHAGAKF
jgi:formylglycine-generating enzyme required for sulfatase activity